MSDKNTVKLLRFFHFLIVLYLVAGIVYIYYSAITLQANLLLWIFIISLVIEGTLVYINRGNCPLGFIQRRFGDNTAFFDLILPHSLAKYAVRFFAMITLLGILLLYIRLALTN